MSRLIDADALNAAMYHEAFETDTDMQKWDSGCWIRYKMFERAIKATPTIEAEPVRHGHWINIWDEDDPDISTFGRCTRCNEISERPLGRYCKWCGAKMDEVTT